MIIALKKHDVFLFVIWLHFIGLLGIDILGSRPMSRRRHTLFEPMGDALAAGDHQLTLD